MVTLELFADAKMDNSGRMSVFASLTAQNSYFDGLTKKTIEGARMNTLGGPIEVQIPWVDVIGYSYGRFQVGSRWFYFSVDDVSPITDTKTRIIYNLDCWETCRHQYGVTLGRGIVTRSGRSLSTRNMRPFSPIYTRTTTVQKFSLANVIGLAFVHDSTEDKNYVYMASDRSAGIGPYVDGEWLSMLGIQNLSDVFGAWLSPFPVDATAWTLIPDQGITGYRIEADALGNADTDYQVNLDTAPYMDQEHCYGITDMRGNLVWSSDLSDDVPGTTMTCDLNISPSTCNWRCYIGENIPERTLTIPCEPVYFYSDAFTEYNVRQREYDMELRSINRDSQLVGGISNIGSSIIGGAVTGAIAGPVGAVGGAVLGAVGSLVGSVASYAIQPTFDDRTQRATDAYYKRQADALVLSGDGLLNILKGKSGCELVDVETDPATMTQYNDAIATGGCFYQSLEVDDMEPFVTAGPLTADVEVLGSIPDAWKAQIRNRISQGVIFV